MARTHTHSGVERSGAERGERGRGALCVMLFLDERRRRRRRG